MEKMIAEWGQYLARGVYDQKYGPLEIEDVDDLVVALEAAGYAVRPGAASKIRGSIYEGSEEYWAAIRREKNRQASVNSWIAYRKAGGK